MFGFFIENDLISQHRFGFKPGGSCINQLLSITHEIYQSFDEDFDVRGVFLDISKAFDKVWHDGIIFKLKQNGISGNLLDMLSNFLRNRKQRVVLADPSKQAQEVIFSRKTKKEYHPPLAFNNNVLETNSQKHVCVILDNRLSFEDHLKMILNKKKR